jgi:hypothetical protein
MARGRLAASEAGKEVTGMSHDERVAASAEGNLVARGRLAASAVRSWTPQQLAQAVEDGDTYYGPAAQRLLAEREVRGMDRTDLASIYALARRSDVYTSKEARVFLMELLVDLT